MWFLFEGHHHHNENVDGFYVSMFGWNECICVLWAVCRWSLQKAMLPDVAFCFVDQLMCVRQLSMYTAYTQMWVSIR